MRDGSTGEIGPGYWCWQVVGVERDSPDVIPLYQALYSQRAPDFVSENQEVRKATRTVLEATGGRGVVVKEEGAKEKEYRLRFGATTVRLPGWRKPLTLVVVRGLGTKPLMLLTSLPQGSRKRVWRVVESYLAIADGIKNSLFGRSRPVQAPEPPPQPPNLPLFPLGP